MNMNDESNKDIDLTKEEFANINEKPVFGINALRAIFTSAAEKYALGIIVALCINCLVWCFAYGKIARGTNLLISIAMLWLMNVDMEKISQIPKGKREIFSISVSWWVEGLLMPPLYFKKRALVMGQKDTYFWITLVLTALIYFKVIIDYIALIIFIVIMLGFGVFSLIGGSGSSSSSSSRKTRVTHSKKTTNSEVSYDNSKEATKSNNYIFIIKDGRAICSTPKGGIVKYLGIGEKGARECSH